MINEVENKTNLNEMSDLERVKNEKEMMRYRPNALSYKLGFGGIAFSVCATFLCLNSFNPTSFEVIIKILLNVFILLSGFLCCEKVKAYSSKASIYMVGLGGVCIARIFWVPLTLLVHFNPWNTAYAEYSTLADQQSARGVELKAIIDAHEPFLGQTIRTKYIGGAQINWLPADGNFRGIAAIVCLIIAAVLFAIGGYIGYKQSKKLTEYLDSIKVTK